MKHRIITNGIKYRIQFALDFGESHENLHWFTETSDGYEVKVRWFIGEQVTCKGNVLEFDSVADAASHVIANGGELLWKVV